MTFLTAAFVLFCQSIEPSAPRGEVGAETLLSVRDVGGAPLAGVVVVVRDPNGDEVRLGTTDTLGGVRFRPLLVGMHELRAELPAAALLLVTPFSVLPPPRRWLYLLLCAPAGVALLWWNLRNLRRVVADG